MTEIICTTITALAGIIVALLGIHIKRSETRADERFKKETYGDAFKEYYTAHYRTMMKVEKVFTASQKQEYVIEQLTEAFLNATEENIQALPKNEQTKQQTHYNFMMAVYALPVMARYKGPAMDALADSLVEEWNQLIYI